MKIIGYLVGEEGYEMTLCLPCSKGYRNHPDSHAIFDDQWGDLICGMCEEEIK